MGDYLLIRIKSFFLQPIPIQEMQLFRKLAGNIFFKIILAFIALSFVLFGVSGFVLNGPNTWVAKVGSKTIGYGEFNKELQKTRDLVLQNNKSEEALKYLDSDQFKSDVLGRLVNGIIVEKLREDFGVEASRKLILGAIAKDINFRGKDGKFDRKAFQTFLDKNGIDEEKYLSFIESDVVATMIIQSMSLASPINESFVVDREEFKQEKRFADVIKISDKNVGKVATPDAEALNKFFEANKKSYTAPEMRKVSFLRFSQRDFVKDLQIKDDEILAEYEKNKDNLQRPESRSVYHILFDKEEAAKDFIQKLDAAAGSDKSKLGATFLKLAKELQNKDAKAVTLKNVTQKDMIADLSDPIFKLSVGQHSESLKSPLGFHVFLLNDIKKAEAIPFAEAKEQIKKSLLQGREEKVMQSKVSEIDDAILASNSLSETAKKFNLSANLNSVEINQAGQNPKGDASAAINGLDEFPQHAFTLKKDEASKLFFSKTGNEYFAIKVEEITPAREKTFEEVKAQVTADLTKLNQAKAAEKLAKTVAEELKANPQNFAAIVAKYKLNVDKNKQIARVSYINYQGHQIPFVDKFATTLFGLKVGGVTEEIQTGDNNFVIGVLRSVQKGIVAGPVLEAAKTEAVNSFKNEVLQGYNAFVMKKYPVKVNEKVLGKKEQE